MLLIAEGVCGQVFADILVFEKDGWFEEQFLDGLEELSCEGFENFKDYGIKISISKDTIPTSVRERKDVK